jgi:hypothetical protein
MSTIDDKIAAMPSEQKAEDGATNTGASYAHAGKSKPTTSCRHPGSSVARSSA